MDYKKSKAPVNTVTRNIIDLCDETGNVYESVAIIGKRANQISVEIKNDLSKKLAEFASYNDCLNLHFWLHKSLWKATFTGVIRHVITWKEIRRNDTAQANNLFVAGPCMPYSLPMYALSYL